MFSVIFIFYVIMNIWFLIVTGIYLKNKQDEVYSKKMILSTYDLGLVDLVVSVLLGIILFITYDIYNYDYRYMVSWILVLMHLCIGFLCFNRFKYFIEFEKTREKQMKENELEYEKYLKEKQKLESEDNYIEEEGEDISCL